MPLYHYTDLNAVISIIEKSAIRLTDLNYLNDSSELHDGLNTLRTELDNLEALHKEDEDDYNKDAIDHLQASFVVGDNSFAESVQLFVCSFSKSRDQLSQWRGYGSYCLVFDEDELEHRLPLHECIYKNQVKITQAKSITARALNQLTTNAKIKDSGFLGDHDVQSLVSLLTTAATFKDSGFIEERETRWISWGEKDTTIEYRIKGNQLIPYITLPIPRKCLKGIIIGPMKDQILAERALISYFQDKNYDLDIEVSRIPYRAP